MRHTASAYRWKPEKWIRWFREYVSKEEQGAYNGMLWSDVCKRMLEEEE